MFLDGWLGNGIGSAVYDVLVNILSKLHPMKIILQYFHCLFYTKMSHFPSVMSFHIIFACSLEGTQRWLIWNNNPSWR
jgi:hypothetical protein